VSAANIPTFPLRMAKTNKPAPIGFGRRAMPDEAGDTPPPKRKASDDLDDELAGDELPPADDPAEPDPVFEELLLRIAETFEVAPTLEEAGLQLTTADVFERLQGLYPSESYNAKMVFNGLQNLGFKYADPFRDMKYVWLFK
jgi:hypothetical protein